MITKSLTFDDVLLIPKYSGLTPETEISISTLLCRGIELKAPFVSAAMDTVTTSAMAIKLARNGGIGIIHRNFSNIEDQCLEITQVKRYQGDMVKNPITLGIENTIQDAIEIKNKYSFATIPIVDSKKRLLGLITERHLDDYPKKDTKLGKIMTKFSELVLAYASTDLSQAEKLLKEKGKKRLPVVVSPKDNTLVGIYFKKDILNKGLYPNMVTDKNGRLLVGAAIGVGEDGLMRAEKLIEVGVDVLCIDTAQGDSRGVVEILKKLKKKFPKIPIIAGNVVTSSGALRLINAGADAIKVGVGPGAICTTRSVTGNGRPQFSSILEVVRVAKKYSIPVISDGGIKETGDVVKAIAAGASSVMMGSVFAGTEESPGDIHVDDDTGYKYKIYRGMGSKEAMLSGSGVSNDRYGANSKTKKVAEGVSGKVPFKGTVQDVLDEYRGSLIQSMRTYQGAKNIKELQKKPIFTEITNAGRIESGIRGLKLK